MEHLSREGLEIDKGKRHCKILDADGETVFRTTNLRDAEHYLELVEEVERLQMLLDSRGIAPHRIYLLAADEEKRGRVNLDHAAANEVVIVAKAGDGVVVRHLDDGKEEIVDLDELEPIEGGSYLQASEATEETAHIIVRIDREEESCFVGAFAEKDGADNLLAHWNKIEETPGSEYSAVLANAEGDLLMFKAEAIIEE